MASFSADEHEASGENIISIAVVISSYLFRTVSLLIWQPTNFEWNIWCCRRDIVTSVLGKDYTTAKKSTATQHEYVIAHRYREDEIEMAFVLWAKKRTSVEWALKLVITDTDICPLISILFLFYFSCDPWKESRRMHDVLRITNYVQKHLFIIWSCAMNNEQPDEKKQQEIERAKEVNRIESVRRVKWITCFERDVNDDIVTHCVPQLFVNVNRMCTLTRW